MADLRFRFIEDYAGGLLNVSRQEISSTGEVLSQDGFTSEGTIFVEDGSGVKSGLKLGVSLVEAIDPTTETGVVNVRFADRTYAKIRDLKIFTTAIASTQAALSDAVASSLSNLENAFELLENDIGALESNLLSNITQDKQKIQELSILQADTTTRVEVLEEDLTNLTARVDLISETSNDVEVKGDLTVKNDSFLTNLTISGQINVSEVKETVYILSGENINPANGTLQVKVLTSGSSTLVHSFEEGQRVTLMLEVAPGASVNFPPSTVWIGSNGNSPPSLTTKNVITFWRANGVFFGNYLGSYS